MEQFNEFGGCILSSKNSVIALQKALQKISNSENFERVYSSWNSKIWAIVGEKTAKILKNSFCPSNLIIGNNAKDLMEKLSDNHLFKSSKLLFLTGSKTLPIIPDTLNSYDIEFQSILCYKSKIKHQNLNLIQHFDWVCFFSPSGVDAILYDNNHQYNEKNWLENCCIASIGKTTEKKLLENGITVHSTAEKPNAESLSKGIISFKKL